VIREILKYPDNILCEPSAPVMIEGCEYANTTSPDGMVAVPMNSKELKSLVDDITDTAMNVPWGRAVGFAAPQIGRPLRVFLALGEIYVNPVITWVSPKIVRQKEGCYSLDNNKLDYETPRHHSIEIAYQAVRWTPQGEMIVQTKRKRFHRFDAQVIQHEYDHINGIACCQEREEEVEAGE